MCFVLFSCLEDETNKNFKMMTPIRIDLTGLPDPGVPYEIYQYDTLRIAPVVYREGVDDARLSFEWQIQGNSVERILSHSMVLNAEIIEPQQGMEYNVILTVTDSTTLVQAYQVWKVKVSDVLGEGLIVADTRDEQTTDLSLIMAMNFTGKYMDDSGDMIFRNLYSRGNEGERIQGVAIDLMMSKYATTSATNSTLTVLTPNSIVRVNPSGYGFVDNCRFILPIDDPMLPRKIREEEWVKYEILNINGHLYPRGYQGTNVTFQMFILTSDMQDYDISEYRCLARGAYPEYVGFAYDEKGKRFLILPNGNGPALSTFQPSSQKYFDPNHIGEKSCLFMGEGVGYTMHALMKDRDKDDYVIYSLKGKIKDDGSDAIKAGAWWLNNCTDINRSLYWSFSRLENIMYYATENTVYATTPLNTESLSANAVYTTLPGEKITSMKVWSESGRCYLPSSSGNAGERTRINSQHRMVVVTTYNEETKEGKVITIPIERTGEGGLCQDRNYHMEYGGFGRIVAVGSQKP